MKKQTAVEWLKKELEEYGSSSHLSLDWETFDELVEQAKAMEKEQIVEAWTGGNYGYFYSKGSKEDFNDGSEYYNEIYKGGEL